MRGAPHPHGAVMLRVPFPQVRSRIIGSSETRPAAWYWTRVSRGCPVHSTHVLAQPLPLLLRTVSRVLFRRPRALRASRNVGVCWRRVHLRICLPASFTARISRERQRTVLVRADLRADRPIITTDVKGVRGDKPGLLLALLLLLIRCSYLLCCPSAKPPRRRADRLPIPVFSVGRRVGNVVHAGDVGSHPRNVKSGVDLIPRARHWRLPRVRGTGAQILPRHGFLSFPLEPAWTWTWTRMTGDYARGSCNFSRL